MNNIFEIEYIKKFPFVKINKRSLLQIIIISLGAGVLGFILETLLVYIFDGVLIDRGFLCGPFVPIYALVIFFSLLYIKVNKPSFSYFIKLFFIFALGITFIEFLIGNLFELLIGVELWNYNEEFPLSYKYISLTVAIIWGLLASVSVIYLIPFLKRKLERIPHRLYPSIIIISLSIIILDFIITILIILKNGYYAPLYKINASIQLTFFMVGIVAYVYASIILGKYIYQHTLVFKKTFMILYVCSLFIPIFSIIDYLKRFDLSFYSFLATIGFIVLGIYIYLLITLLLILIISRVLELFMKRKINKKINYVSFSLIVSIIITIVGIYNAYNPYISCFKMGEGNKSIKIACVSDVHYKTTGYKANLTRMVKMINEVKPDITVLLGDIIDAKTEDIDKEYFIDNINNIKSRYGVYAVIGNHELNYNSVDEIKNIYSLTSVRLLLDEVVSINNEIALVGRKDKSYGARLPLSSLINNISVPIIVLDHQPTTFEETISNGINYQLSGHTHNGQMFPMNYIVKIYNTFVGNIPLSSGFYVKNGHYLFVSKGYGCWGFPLRTSGKGEIVSMELLYDE